MLDTRGAEPLSVTGAIYLSPHPYGMADKPCLSIYGHDVLDRQLIYCGLGVIGVALIIWLRRRSEQKLPPGPWGFPIVGYLPFLARARDAPFVTLTWLARRYGPVYRLRLGTIPTVVVSDPRLVRIAFNRDVFCARPPLFVTNGILEGYGLISAEGERWKEQRRFTATCLRDFGASKSKLVGTELEERISGEVDAFLQKVKREGGRPFDVHLLLRKTVANLTTAMVFGKHFEEDDAEFCKELDVADEGSKMVDVAGVLNFLPLLRFLPRFRRFVSTIWSMKRDHHRFLMRIVEEHRRNRLLHGDCNSEGRNFIDAYLSEMDKRRLEKKPSHFTEKQLLHLLSDMFGASLDTLKATVKWTVLYLMSNEDVQKKSQDELDAVVGRSRDPQLDDFSRCPYTVAVMYEAQRLASVVPLGAPHGCSHDTLLDGYSITKGTMIIPLLWAIHRDESLWPEPLLFRPERFLDEDGNVFKPDHFIPFSTGRRMCVGEELARMTLFLVISKALHHFTFVLPEGASLPDMTPISGFVISPRPFQMCAIPRD